MARLVAIGDSLTQGFTSLAVSQVEFSYPAMIARCMGIGAAEFRVPDFRGSGGLPLNLEWLARELQRRHGPNLNAFEWITSLFDIHSILDDVEDYWERGAGARAGIDVDYHNLAVWGFEVADAYNITALTAVEKLAGTKDEFIGIPGESRMRTAARVLNPPRAATRQQDTQLTVAKRFADRDGGIDHLVVFLGANNCLGTVVRLKLHESTAAAPGPFSDYTLWHAKAFEAEYETLAAQIETIGAKHVYLATVPHVTIPPLTRGVMKTRGVLPAGQKYFDYYTYFFVHDKEFDVSGHPHLTGDEARHIDQRIDAYNKMIRKIAAAHENWHVVDVCAMLDELAVRRNHGSPTFKLPPALADLSVRFFETQPGGRLRNGGLIGLDGIHPTFCGYALVAQRFIEAMRPHEATLHPNGAGIRDIDFADARRWDTLVSRPPGTLDDVMGMLRMLEARFNFLRWYR
ncbi:MAG: hypothetical protein WC654_00040 [Patescibacteria group bacterium]